MNTTQPVLDFSYASTLWTYGKNADHDTQAPQASCSPCGAFS